MFPGWLVAQMDLDVKTLEEAVLAFYQNAKKKESTHEYLMQMQESPMAWQFAWDLMLPQKVGSEHENLHL